MVTQILVMCVKYGLEPLNFLFLILQCSNCHEDGGLLFHILNVLFTAKI